MDDPRFGLLSRLFDENNLKAAGPPRKSVLVIVDDADDYGLDDARRYFANNGLAVEFARVADFDDKDARTSKFDVIVLSGMPRDLNLFAVYTALLVAGGTFIVQTEDDKAVKRLKMYGFLNVGLGATSGTVVGYAPAYKVGSSDKVTLNSKANENDVVSAWKLDDNNSETIAEDDLLEADDLKRPTSSSLKVCATTKKTKACKNCSCGLAEELKANHIKNKAKLVPDTSNAKSSCGSCYLGDAFRCASCPYLGMPAFKPGEKVQLAGNLLQDDF